MAKKTPINIDNGALAAGFFSIKGDTAEQAPNGTAIKAADEQPEEKRKGGRPPKTQKKEKVNIYLYPKEHQRLKDIAQKHGVPFSSFVASIIERYLTSETTNETVLQLMASNLNEEFEALADSYNQES